jgi:hypothetical protein
LRRLAPKKKIVFSACVIGAGDVGRDCNPSPPSSLLHSTAKNKHQSRRQKKRSFFFFSEPSSKLNGHLTLVNGNGKYKLVLMHIKRNGNLFHLTIKTYLTRIMLLH